MAEGKPVVVQVNISSVVKVLSSTNLDSLMEKIKNLLKRYKIISVNISTHGKYVTVYTAMILLRKD